MRKLIHFLTTVVMMTPLYASDDNRPANREAWTRRHTATGDSLSPTGLPEPGKEQIPAYKADKLVGIFYFVWHGANDPGGPYDNSKIIAQNPNAASSDSA